MLHIDTYAINKEIERMGVDSYLKTYPPQTISRKAVVYHEALKHKNAEISSLKEKINKLHDKIDELTDEVLELKHYATN